MTDAGLDLQGFQLNVGAQGREEVVALGGRSSGRGLLQRGILLQRFVIDLDAPSSFRTYAKR